MNGKERKAYAKHKEQHVPNLNGTTIQAALERISMIESNQRSPLRKQMTKDEAQRSSLDAGVAIQAYKEYIKRLTTL